MRMKSEVYRKGCCCFFSSSALLLLLSFVSFLQLDCLLYGLKQRALEHYYVDFGSDMFVADGQPRCHSFSASNRFQCTWLRRQSREIIGMLLPSCTKFGSPFQDSMCFPSWDLKLLKLFAKREDPVSSDSSTVLLLILNHIMSCYLVKRGDGFFEITHQLIRPVDHSLISVTCTGRVLFDSPVPSPTRKPVCSFGVGRGMSRFVTDSFPSVNEDFPFALCLPCRIIMSIQNLPSNSKVADLFNLVSLSTSCFVFVLCVRAENETWLIGTKGRRNLALHSPRSPMVDLRFFFFSLLQIPVCGILILVMFPLLVWERERVWKTRSELRFPFIRRCLLLLARIPCFSVVHFIGGSSVICTGRYLSKLPLRELISKYVLPEAQAAITAQFAKAAQPPGLHSTFCPFDCHPSLCLFLSFCFVIHCCTLPFYRRQSRIWSSLSSLGWLDSLCCLSRLLTLFQSHTEADSRPWHLCRHDWALSLSSWSWLESRQISVPCCIVSWTAQVSSIRSLLVSFWPVVFMLLLFSLQSLFSPLQPVVLVLSSLFSLSNPIRLQLEKAFPEVCFVLCFLPWLSALLVCSVASGSFDVFSLSLSLSLSATVSSLSFTPICWWFMSKLKPRCAWFRICWIWLALCKASCRRFSLLALFMPSSERRLRMSVVVWTLVQGQWVSCLLAAARCSLLPQRFLLLLCLILLGTWSLWLI